MQSSVVTLGFLAVLLYTVFAVEECPSGGHCEDGQTCCKNPTNGYECCPFTRAVCCEDQIHCCPEGSLCDLETSKCISVSSKKQLPLWAKFPARIRAEWRNQKEYVTSDPATVSEHEEELEKTTDSSVNPGEDAFEVKCDDRVSCPDNWICCKEGVGVWGCCPEPYLTERRGDVMFSGLTLWSMCLWLFLKGVCCWDHLHCCPYGYECEKMRCRKGNEMTPRKPAFTTAALTATVAAAEGESNVCSDTETSCVGGCCPQPNARCCGRSKGCCPHDHKCCRKNRMCQRRSRDPLVREDPGPAQSKNSLRLCGALIKNTPTHVSPALDCVRSV